MGNNNWDDDDDDSVSISGLPGFGGGGGGGRSGGGGFGGGGGGGGGMSGPSTSRITPANNAPKPWFGKTSNSGTKRGNDPNNWARSVKMTWASIPFFGTGNTFWGRTIWDWVKKPKYHFCDIIDRVNCSFVPALLLFFVAIVSANIFGFNNSDAMRCLKSQELNNEEFEYAVEICQTKNVYYVPPDEGIPWPNQERRRRELGYYHWVPITLILQALLFYLPNWIWSHLNRATGADFASLIQESREATTGKETEYDGRITTLASHISNTVMDRTPRRLHGCKFGRTLGAYISLLYVFIKGLYLLNVAGQFFALNAFVGRSYGLWGYQVMSALVNGENWQDSPVFPRLALCDVPIRRLGDVPRYTLQCHLRINTYNEKIYLFIWWFFLVLSCITALNFLYYLFYLILCPWSRERTVRYLLKGQDQFKSVTQSRIKRETRLVRRFATDHLRYDGVLLFWFIEGHAGPIVARELLGKLFQSYLDEKEDDEKSLLSAVSVDEDMKKRGGKGGNGSGSSKSSTPTKKYKHAAAKKQPSFSSQSTGSVENVDPVGGGGEGGGLHRGGGGGFGVGEIAPKQPLLVDGENGVVYRQNTAGGFPPVGWSIAPPSFRSVDPNAPDREELLLEEDEYDHQGRSAHGQMVPGTPRRHQPGHYRQPHYNKHHGSQRRGNNALVKAFKKVVGAGGGSGSMNDREQSSPLSPIKHL